MSKLLTVVVLFGLNACLERPLEIHQNAEEFPPPPREALSSRPPLEEVPEPAEEPLKNLMELTYKKAAVGSEEEELVDLILEHQEDPEKLALSMREVRLLQEAYMKGLKHLPPEEPEPLPIRKSLGLETERPCAPVSPRLKVLENGLRVATYLPRQDPCLISQSKKIEEALNAILVGKRVRASYFGQRASLRKLQDFRKFLAAAGFELSAQYRIYLAPFLRLYRSEGDLYKSDAEIPTPFWIDTDLLQKNGEKAIVPAVHSEVLFSIRKNDESPALVKAYFSDRGFVFDDDDLHLPSWTGERVLVDFSPSQIDVLLETIPKLHKAFEIFKEEAKVPLRMEGFGLLGVCNDGSALLVRAALGSGFALPFPLVRTDLISMPKKFPAKALWESLISDTFQKSIDIAPEEKRKLLIPRLINSNPFDGSSPFPTFDSFIQEIQGENL